ncbi:MAG: hypothetical protein HY718_11530, partial [Planctomycetes bacterium]|nr:hypothetical protein [Planctomycetota bacterium]
MHGGSLLIAALLAAPGAAQVAPLVPLGDAKAEEAMLPAGISRNKPELFGQYVHVWALDDGTHVIQYYGDFTLHLGARRLASRDAVIWAARTRWKELTYYHYDVFLSQEATVRDAAGTVSSGATLFVTFNSFQPPDLEMDADSAEPSADTTLYLEAWRVRQQILAGQREEGEPGEMSVVDLDRQRAGKAVKPRPIVRYRSTQPATIDEKNGTITIAGDVYLSQGLVESGEFVEIRANAAVLFLVKEEPRPAGAEKDVLAPEGSKESMPGPGGVRAPGAGGPFGGIGGGLGGGGPAGAAVAGTYLRGDVVLT